MTTSRAVRGTKSRIFIYICAVLIITGIIACYNSTLSQLDEIRKAKDQCHQQQENLSTQLQVIFDYKQRLEKSLKTEKADHQQSKADLESKLADEKSKNEKIMKDDELQLSALKQNYKLLKTQYDDYKAKTSKTETEQLHQITTLQEQLKNLQSDHENLKTQLINVNNEKESIKEQIKKSDNGNSNDEVNQLKKENGNLKKEIEELKSQFPTLQSSMLKKSSSDGYNVEKGVNFEENAGIGQMAPPNSNNDENNQPLKNVPNLQSKSSTKTMVKSSKQPSRTNLDDAKPLNLPTVTSSSVKSSPGINHQIIPLPYVNRQNLPNGVVPPPNEVDELQQHKPEINQDSVHFPERYRHKIDKIVKSDQVNDISNHLLNIKDDNKAQEELDAPLNNRLPDEPPFVMDDNNQNNNDKAEFQHIMKIKSKNEDQDYDRNGHDAAIEEEEEDDIEDYANGIAHQKEPAVRH